MGIYGGAANGMNILAHHSWTIDLFKLYCGLGIDEGTFNRFKVILHDEDDTLLKRIVMQIKQQTAPLSLPGEGSATAAGAGPHCVFKLVPFD